MGALKAYIADQQSQALRLESILEALQELNSANVAPDAQSSLIGLAYGMAIDLNEALDSVNLPKEDAA
ncbi:hypothetical protein [Paracoccus sp. 22332]|uniref:hypothetical protein n=1 Tax=Paracoccus sp. 22332 TaxID=3453913 RepID=UPI003F873029